jgi:hypothetical protein
VRPARTSIASKTASPRRTPSSASGTVASAWGTTVPSIQARAGAGRSSWAAACHSDVGSARRCMGPHVRSRGSTGAAPSGRRVRARACIAAHRCPVAWAGPGAPGSDGRGGEHGQRGRPRRHRWTARRAPSRSATGCRSTATSAPGGRARTGPGGDRARRPGARCTTTSAVSTRSPSSRRSSWRARSRSPAGSPAAARAGTSRSSASCRPATSRPPRAADATAEVGEEVVAPALAALDAGEQAQGRGHVRSGTPPARTVPSSCPVDLRVRGVGRLTRGRAWLTYPGSAGGVRRAAALDRGDADPVRKVRTPQGRVLGNAQAW